MRDTTVSDKLIPTVFEEVRSRVSDLIKTGEFYQLHHRYVVFCGTGCVS